MTPLPPIAILAGGLGTRLQSITHGRPKALAEVNGRPFLIRQLELLRHGGFQRAVICAGYRSEQIVECISGYGDLGIEVRYSFDGPDLLGTGGAIRRALPLLGSEFFVIYGDSFLDCDYGEIWREFLLQGKLALMTVFQNEGQWDSSNVHFADSRILLYSKTERRSAMRHIDYGLGVFRGAAFRHLAEDEPCDLSLIYQQLLSRNELGAVELSKRFYEIGTPQGLEDLSRHLRTRGASL